MTRDAGAPPTWPVAGSGDNATAVGLYAAIVTALYRRERTGKGSYVTTSLLAQGVWSASVSIQAALCEANFYAPHDRKNPANAAMNVYRASDGTWFVLIVTPDKLAAVAKAIGRADLLTDPRFSDPTKLVENMPQLTAILDEVFGFHTTPLSATEKTCVLGKALSICSSATVPPIQFLVCRVASTAARSMPAAEYTGSRLN
jgi:crotonobetainyl-CoA:carnitine CoA-transferase CaiB-like acyl-CoA transferase